MAPTKKRSPRRQTVFFGRETAVRREDVSKLLPSVEATPEEEDDCPLVVSDLLDKESSGEDEGFSTPPEDNAVGRKRPRSSTISDKEKSPKPPPPKRGRRTNKISTAKPRRSTRISATEKVESKVVAAKKTGRGRPPKKPSTPDACSSPGSQREWEVERIVESQVDAATQEHFYKVKWKGFPAKDNTWEPKKNLSHCLQAIRDYEKGSKK